MRQFKPLVVVLLGVLVFGGVVAVGASARKATPEILPIGGFTDKSGEVKYAAKGVFGASTITCASSASRGGFTTSLLGTFDLLFEKCLVNEPIVGLLLCTGLNDTVTSSILVLGTFHLRYRELGTSTKTVIAYLLIPVHYTCKGGAEALIEWRGCLAGEVTPVNKAITLPSHFTLTAKKSSTATLNEITKIASETGTTLETCMLEANQNGGAFSQLAVEATDEIFPKSTMTEIMA